MLKINYLFAFLWAAILLGSSQSFAQSSFIFTTTTVPSLTSSQQEAYQKVLNSPFTVQTWFLNVNALSTAQSDGMIKFELPTNNCGGLTFAAKHVDYESDNQYEWQGEYVTECDTCVDCLDGAITLIKEPNKTYGHISIDADVYEIYNIGGKTLLAKLNTDAMNGNECGVNSVPNTGEPTFVAEEEQETKSLGAGCNVRVLVLFNQAAANQTPDMNALANLAIGQTNQILRNSAITSYNLNIVLAAVQPIVFTLTGQRRVAEDMFAFSTLPAVVAARQAANADLVMFITGDDYITRDGNYDIAGATQQGIDDVWQLGANRYVGFVEANNAVSSRYTFAHELGHLFLAGHNDDPRPGIVHAKNFNTNCNFFGVSCRKHTTVMGKMLPDRARIMHFSNPDVNYIRKSTGDAGTKNNARVMLDNACTVAAYNPNDFFLVGMEGAVSWACPDNFVLLTAQASGLIAPFQYQWRISNDGINYSAVQSTNQSYGAPTRPLNGQRVFVRLTVTHTATSQTRTITHSIQTTTTGQGGINCQRSSRLNVSEGFKITVSPNPSTNQHVYLDLELDKETELSFSVLNAVGQVITTFPTTNYAKGKQYQEIYFPNLPNGTYFLRVVSPDRSVEKLEKITIFNP